MAVEWLYMAVECFDGFATSEMLFVRKETVGAVARLTCAGVPRMVESGADRRNETGQGLCYTETRQSAVVAAPSPCFAERREMQPVAVAQVVGT